jgi:hypothetical protein
MRTLRQEMNVPLPDVERKWLRRSATIILVPFVLITSLGYHLACAISRVANDCVEIISDCW